VSVVRPFTLYFPRGDTLDLSLLLPPADDLFPDLTGATARLHVRDGAGVLALECSTGNGLMTVLPSARQIDVLVPKASNTLEAGAHDFDFEITWPGGDPRRTIGPGIMLIGKDYSHD
jgi:hypothetical protein